MHIVKVITKNTSSLDFVLPILVDLHEMGHKISIISLTSSKKKLTSYIATIDQGFGKTIDLYGVDTLFGGFLGQKLALCVERLPDLISLYEIRQLLVRKPKTALSQLVEKIIIKLFFKITRKKQIFKNLNVDACLYDLRHDPIPIFKNDILMELDKRKIPVFLTQHAPHMRTKYGEYVPIGLKKHNLNITRMLSHQQSQIPKHIQKIEPAMYIGCPSLDDWWLKRLSRNLHTQVYSKPKIVYISRRIADENVRGISNRDSYILSYNDVADRFKQLSVLAKKLGRTVHIKPHPNTNAAVLKKLILNHQNFKIIQGSITDVMSKNDIVIAEPSTLVLTTALLGIETYIVNDQLQKEIEKKWPHLKILYSGFSFVGPNNISTVQVNDSNSKMLIQRIRNTFPDDATKRATSLIIGTAR